MTSDGQHVVPGSWESTIRVWEMSTVEASGAPLTGHTEGVSIAEISTAGENVASDCAEHRLVHSKLCYIIYYDIVMIDFCQPTRKGTRNSHRHCF